MSAVAVAAELHDVHRGVSYAKPRWRGWLHLVSFEVALVVGTLLVVTAQGTLQTWVALVYAVSVAGLFGVSAAYHRGRWSLAGMRRMQRLDHAMIVVLIAGTATPPMVVALDGAWRVAGLVGVWALSAATVVMRLAWMAAPEKLIGLVYVGLGWLSGLAVPAVWLNVGATPALMLLAGGILYSLGALCYHRRRPDPVPHVFGYHEVFHLFVCVAAACQYLAVAELL